MLTELTTVDDVIDALGGTGATARLLGCKSMRPVSNWRSRGRLPADKFLLMQQALRDRGKTAPPSLWGIAPPSRGAAA